MKIKPSQKRIEFERFLLSLGIRDRNPITYPKYVEERILDHIYPELTIYFTVRDYKNKKSYLYEYYKKYSKKKTADLLSKIKYNQKNNIFEVIWMIDGNLRNLTISDSKIILFAFIKEMRKKIFLKKLLYLPVEIHNPNPNDILMCKPTGSQVVEIPENFMIGVKQRASLYKRLGFGELDEDLRQYAIYDENMILHPI